MKMFSFTSNQRNTDQNSSLLRIQQDGKNISYKWDLREMDIFILLVNIEALV